MLPSHTIPSGSVETLQFLIESWLSFPYSEVLNTGPGHTCDMKNLLVLKAYGVKASRNAV